MKRMTIGQRLDLFLSGCWLRPAAIGVALLCAGMMLGAVMPPPRAALAEVTVPPPPEAFKSGGQLSVPILQDISATLHQIDGRLARMEAFFNKLAQTPSRGASN